MGYLLLTTMSQTANSCYTSSNFLSLSRARPPSTAEDCSACCYFLFQAEDGIRYVAVTGFQTCALPIWEACRSTARHEEWRTPWLSMNRPRTVAYRFRRMSSKPPTTTCRLPRSLACRPAARGPCTDRKSVV